MTTRNAIGDELPAMAFLVPGMVEAQEARGQSMLAAQADKLPTRCEGRADLEKRGVVFGEPVDKLFTSVTLPAGWKIRPFGDTSYWTELVDDKGRRHAMIFYKAAFYDRDAFARACDPDATQ